MSRTTISAAHLYEILDREFRGLKSRDCAKCRAPLPIWRRPPDDASANWDIGDITQCPEGCHRVIGEMLMRLASKYDMEPERPQ